jgi:hypothetical protein
MRAAHLNPTRIRIVSGKAGTAQQKRSDRDTPPPIS